MSKESTLTDRTLGEDTRQSKISPGSSLYLILAAVADDLLGGRERCIPLPSGQILLGRGERDAVIRLGGEAEVRVLDHRMSGSHASIRPALTERGEPRGLLIQDLGSTNGTRVNGQKISSALLLPGHYMEVGRTFFTCALLNDEEDVQPLLEDGSLGPTRSVDPVVLAQISRARKIAPSQVSVLILGESGTGKEVLAQEIHKRSGRRGRMVAVHCGAIPENLLESELFGYKKGAFTGATSNHEGLVAAADGGTLFLDEIGEMTPAAQVRLLRVLQEREVVPVGDTQPRKVDIRLIAATHRDLRSQALSGRFRGDLYARLEGISFHLPRLAERRGDLGILIAHFLRKYAGDKAPLCAPNPAALRLLFSYNWPFNIRELEKIIEAAVALSGGERAIEPRDLPPALRQNAPSSPPSSEQLASCATAGTRRASSRLAPLSPEDEALKARLIEALREHDGNISAVAREWGKARMQIQRWMKRFSLRSETG